MNSGGACSRKTTVLVSVLPGTSSLGQTAFVELSALTENVVDLLGVVCVELHGRPDLRQGEVGERLVAYPRQVSTVEVGITDHVVNARASAGQGRCPPTSFGVPHDLRSRHGAALFLPQATDFADQPQNLLCRPLVGSDSSFLPGV
jgi:hypothetical protein